MNYFLEIKPRNAESRTILILGINSIELDRGGWGKDNKPFSRMTIRYVNNKSESISFKSDDDEYATQIYSEIKVRATELLNELNSNGKLSSYFSK